MRKESVRGVLTSSMEFRKRYKELIALAVFAAGGALLAGQNPPPAGAPSPMDSLNAMMAGGKSAWTPEELRTMERLRDAAMKDPYALDELRHLADNIGPRLSGPWTMLPARCARWAPR
jgi:hypothetical protein